MMHEEASSPGNRGRLRTYLVDREGVDSRSVHHHMFHRLTPPAHPYYAGHYRGENFPCLFDYQVMIPADPLVGTHYATVDAAVALFGQDLLAAAAALDASFALPDARLSQESKLYFAVVVAARAFQEFLTIHPYANGNGHMARFLVWLLLGRYGYWPRSWTIDPQPNVAGYSGAIFQHRRHQPRPLEQLILEALV